MKPLFLCLVYCFVLQSEQLQKSRTNLSCPCREPTREKSKSRTAGQKVVTRQSPARKCVCAFGAHTFLRGQWRGQWGVTTFWPVVRLFDVSEVGSLQGQHKLVRLCQFSSMLRHCHTSVACMRSWYSSTTSSFRRNRGKMEWYTPKTPRSWHLEHVYKTSSYIFLEQIGAPEASGASKSFKFRPNNAITEHSKHGTIKKDRVVISLQASVTCRSSSLSPSSAS